MEAIVVSLLGAISKPLIEQLLPKLFSGKNEEQLNRVYLALSKHKALDFMLHPNYPGDDHDKQWEELDYYYGRTKDYFGRTFHLGTDGRKARIMMLLLWIIVQALDGHKIATELDAVVMSAISANLADPPMHVHHKAIVKKLVKAFKKKIPRDLAVWIDVPSVLNFDRRVLIEQFRDAITINAREYSVYNDPSVILHGTRFVIAPTDKETMRVIAWARKLHMGNEVKRNEDIKRNLIWNVFLSRECIYAVQIS